MNREIIYKFDVMEPRQLTRQEAQEMDRKEPWRRRIPSGAMEDLNALRVLILWADKILGSAKNQAWMRELGEFRKARSGLGMMRSAAEGLLQNVSAEQLRTIDANWQTMNVTLSAYQMVPGFVNVEIDVMNTLIRQTLVSCQEKMCMMDEKASRACPVRRALDNCINAGRFAGNHEAYLGLCPYCLRDLNHTD